MGAEHQLLHRATKAAADREDPVVQSPEPQAPQPAPLASPITVGAAADPAEAAADRMAESALSRLRSSAEPVEQESPLPGNAIHRSAAPVSGPAPVVGPAGGPLDAQTAEMLASRRGGGRPLEGAVLRRMERAFDRPLSNLRIHDDPAAARLNQAVSARAFTLGSDIFFGGGQFRPDTPTGEHVLAHEIAHTVQSGPGVHRLIDSSACVIRRDPTDTDVTTDQDQTDTDPQPHAGNHPGDGLSAEATSAFTVAKQHNPEYFDAEFRVRAWMTKSQQKEISEIASHSERSKGDADKRALKDLLRAYLMKEYVDIVGDRVMQATDGGPYLAPTKAQKKAMADKYFQRTLKNRNDHRGLIKLGPYSPEVRTWLKDQHFEAAIPRSPAEEATDAGGPRVDVRCTFIGDRKLGRMHLFIVYTDSQGEQVYFRGGPDENDTYTECDMGRYEPGGVDWDPAAQSVTVAKGPAAQTALDKLIEAGKRIDAMQVPYHGYEVSLNKAGLGSLGAFLNGENCNSVAWTLLDRAGLPKKKPSGAHPGWGHVLGDFKKTGNAMAAEDDTSGPGTPKVLAGNPGDKIGVYHDQWHREKITELDAGTAVGLLQQFGEDARIKFGPQDQVGYVDLDEVTDPPRPRKVGRMFWITGKKFELVALSGTASGQVADAWHQIEVLDDGFTVGKKGNVDIRYVDPYNQAEIEGQIDGARLSDVDPAKAPQQVQVQVQVQPQVTGVQPKVGAQQPVRDQVPDNAVTTTRDVKFYDENGERHRLGGLVEGKKKTFIPTGRIVETDHGTVVEFTCVDPVCTAFAMAGDWQRLFGRKYPGL